jgi:hypothetical protein
MAADACALDRVWRVTARYRRTMYLRTVRPIAALSFATLVLVEPGRANACTCGYDNPVIVPASDAILVPRNAMIVAQSWGNAGSIWLREATTQQPVELSTEVLAVAGSEFLILPDGATGAEYRVHDHGCELSTVDIDLHDRRPRGCGATGLRWAPELHARDHAVSDRARRELLHE